MKQRVVLVDDHVAIRDLLRLVLDAQNDFEVIGEAGTGAEGLRVCRRAHPNLAIIDLILPELSGIEVISRLRKECPNTRVVVFSGVVDEEELANMLATHPHGFVRKLDPLADLLNALRTVKSGGRFYSSALDRLLDYPMERTASLTSREVEVLQLVAEGRTNKVIAMTLGVATKTIDNHRTNLMQKLNLHNVAALTRYAIKAHLIHT